MSSKQLWPAGPRNAKVAWKKRATPKAKAAPVNPGDGEHAAPKARSKAHKKIEKKNSSSFSDNRFHVASW